MKDEDLITSVKMVFRKVTMEGAFDVELALGHENSNI